MRIECNKLIRIYPWKKLIATSSNHKFSWNRSCNGSQRNFFLKCSRNNLQQFFYLISVAVDATNLNPIIPKAFFLFSRNKSDLPL